VCLGRAYQPGPITIRIDLDAGAVDAILARLTAARSDAAAAAKELIAGSSQGRCPFLQVIKSSNKKQASAVCDEADAAAPRLFQQTGSKPWRP
jgi:hypothetical protein